MSTSARFCFTVALAMFSSVCSPTSMSDLCSVPQVAPTRPGSTCRAQPVLYRTHGQTDKAELAQVLMGYTRGGDVYSPVYNHYLRTSAGNLIALGEFKQANNFWANRKLFEMLELRSTNIGVAGVDPAMFYDRVIEGDSGNYCVVYQLKPPFTGVLKDCLGSYDSVEGKAGYLSGVTNLSAAVRLACSRIEADTSRKCQNNDVDAIGARLQRSADGSLYYLITLRRRLKDTSELRMSEFGIPSFPVQFDYLVYRVDALGGLVTLFEHARQDPTRAKLITDPQTSQ